MCHKFTKLIFMNRSYIIYINHPDGAYVFLTMEEDETVTVYSKYPQTPACDIFDEICNIAQVPAHLVQEIEERASWNSPMSSQLREFTNQLLDIVRKLNSWYSSI